MFGFWFCSDSNVNIECCLKDEETLLNLCSEPVRCRYSLDRRIDMDIYFSPYKQRTNLLIQGCRGTSLLLHRINTLHLFYSSLKNNCNPSTSTITSVSAQNLKGYLTPLAEKLKLKANQSWFDSRGCLPLPGAG